MEYRTKRLRDKDRLYGSLEAAYRRLRYHRFTRKEIALELRMTVCALEKLITRWNKAKKEQEREQVNP